MVAHALITRSRLLTRERSTGIICSTARDAHRHERYSALASVLFLVQIFTQFIIMK